MSGPMLEDDFRKKFPHLAKELAEEKMKIRIDEVRTQPTEDRENTLSDYVPDVVNFIRRCDTLGEALEIVDYLEKRNELSFDAAVKLRAQLKLRGVRSFGSKKEVGYYETLVRKR
ncbi:DUF2095 domain-containing protein [Candidatus Bathyarchaeota archaeon]|nr:DUF2095 domain-containing protein [Candidatus Bathyarchaeota archaeon]